MMGADEVEAALNGRDLFGQPIKRVPVGPVAEKFGFPPFSVLDARQGDWQERKRAWIGLGIQSEIGRGDGLTYRSSKFDEYRVKEGIRAETDEQGTSIFDPTLCECVYRWFCPNAGQVVDPFAGGSVRGIVASMMGRKYWGCDLRAEQIEANQKQGIEMGLDPCPQWVCGDSLEKLDDAPMADFVFSCPPYGDLERYSDDPSDLSTMEWHTFRAAYSRIIMRSIKRLKDNRFACFVVGDFRGKNGCYRDFVSATIAAFRESGADLYNEAILVTAVGSASMRVTKQFAKSRKFAKTHQNVLVFCKGDWAKAAHECNKDSGSCEVTDAE
jgi:DNA modification methylase